MKQGDKRERAAVWVPALQKQKERERERETAAFNVKIIIASFL